MIENIYLYENRTHLNYLKPYIDKAESLGFKVTLINDASLQNNTLFEQFKKVYKHYSVNPYDFEVACFARYFAIVSILKNDDPFILTDTDVFITNSFRDFQGLDYKGIFVGSEGYDALGSEGQISPHCTLWDRALMTDFTQFVLDTYKRNYENDFLESYYHSQTERLKYTAVSDMNLIYMWINANKVPFVNSNSTKFPLRIDHSIASLVSADGVYKSFTDRKFVKLAGDECFTFLKSGEKQKMALMHFQGVYKAALRDFYLGKSGKLLRFSVRRYYKQKRREIKAKLFSKTS